VNRGDVWWYHRPGRKPRPALILTRDDAIPWLARLVVVPATTNVRGAPTEVHLDTDDGMPKPCVLTLDNLWTVRKALLTDRITRLSPARMHEVCGTLALATGC
jgi:mRNA interferase MazF